MCCVGFFFAVVVSVEKKRELVEITPATVSIRVHGRRFFEKEQDIVTKMSQLENMVIPSTFDYDRVNALSNEALQKFKKIKPSTLGQASRISGENQVMYRY